MSIVVISSYVVAFLLAVTRLAPFTKPYWAWLPKVVQNILPAIVSALPIAINAFTGVKTGLDFTQAVLITFAFLAPGMSSPHNHPELPPPSGTLGTNADKPKPPSLPPLAAAMLCLVFLGTGCAWFNGSFWPVVESCAPSPATLISQVAAILAAGGDYETALEQLALTAGKDAVICAVRAFLGQPAAAPEVEQSPARVNGRAFLKAAQK